MTCKTTVSPTDMLVVVRIREHSFRKYEDLSDQQHRGKMAFIARSFPKSVDGIACRQCSSCHGCR